MMGTFFKSFHFSGIFFLIFYLFFFFLQTITSLSIFLYTNWILHHDWLDLYEF